MNHGFDVHIESRRGAQDAANVDHGIAGLSSLSQGDASRNSVYLHSVCRTQLTDFLQAEDLVRLGARMFC
jgi:hypothetical protein